MRLRIVIPVLIVSLAVGFIVVYRNLSMADELDQAAATAVEQISITTGSEPAVPEDICYTEKVESVVFSHQKHAVELEFDCVTCHSDIFQMDAYSVEAREDFDMSGLHEGKYCGSCHSSKTQVAFPVDSQCARCHRGVKGAERLRATGSDQEGKTNRKGVENDQ